MRTVVFANIQIISVRVRRRSYGFFKFEIVSFCRNNFLLGNDDTASCAFYALSQSAFGTGGLNRVENMLVVSECFNGTRFCLVAPLALCRFGTVGSTGRFERYREIIERMTDNVGIVILKRFTACFAGMKSISLFTACRLDYTAIVFVNMLDIARSVGVFRALAIGQSICFAINFESGNRNKFCCSSGIADNTNRIAVYLFEFENKISKPTPSPSADALYPGSPVITTSFQTPFLRTCIFGFSQNQPPSLNTPPS